MNHFSYYNVTKERGYGEINGYGKYIVTRIGICNLLFTTRFTTLTTSSRTDVCYNAVLSIGAKICCMKRLSI